jgi:hypothetical protein
MILWTIPSSDGSDDDDSASSTHAERNATIEGEEAILAVTFMGSTSGRGAVCTGH